MAAMATPHLSTHSTPATPAPGSFSQAAAAPSSNANAASAHPQPSPLPPPATFDVLPHLRTLLNRLLIPRTTDASTAEAGPADGASQQTSTQPGDDGKAAAGAGPGPIDPDAAPLEIHQLAAASSALKVRLQKARQATARLGDMDRTTQEQEEEIREQEERVRRLRGLLEDLGVGTATAVRGVGAGGEGTGPSVMVVRNPRPV